MHQYKRIQRMYAAIYNRHEWNNTETYTSTNNTIVYTQTIYIQ